MSNLKAAIDPIIEKYSGRISLDIRDSEGNTLITNDENSIFPTASTIKIFILGALLEMVEAGKCSLSDEIVMKPEDQVGGSGILKEFTSGRKYPVKDVAMAMIILSDNTATNMLVDLVGGVQAVNAHIRKHGLIETKLVNKIDFEAIGDDVHNLAVATAMEFTDYLTLVVNNKVFCKELVDVWIDIMSRQQYLDQFPRYIPYNPYARELNVSQDIVVANKTGFYTGVRCDVGYLFLPQGKFIYSVLAKDSEDKSFSPENEAAITLGRIG